MRLRSKESKGLNFTIPTSLVNTCVPVSKSECVIYEIFYFLWYVICLKVFLCAKESSSASCHSLSFVSEWGRRGGQGKVGSKKITKYDIERDSYKNVSFMRVMYFLNDPNWAIFYEVERLLCTMMNSKKDS